MIDFEAYVPWEQELLSMIESQMPYFKQQKFLGYYKWMASTPLSAMSKGDLSYIEHSLKSVLLNELPAHVEDIEIEFIRSDNFVSISFNHQPLPVESEKSAQSECRLDEPPVQDKNEPLVQDKKKIHLGSAWYLISGIFLIIPLLFTLLGYAMTGNAFFLALSVMTGLLAVYGLIRACLAFYKSY